ncbi:flagellar biosynthesis anti-sigma factor FlgM [Pantoea sp.]|uniref:flagellar biosynthesis anti-sigma factor FlgM n=1 Tax=Pantoea sp. TaxID=69393 RepID=UPI0031D44338
MKIISNQTGIAPVTKSVTASLNDTPAKPQSGRATTTRDKESQAPLQAAQQQLREMPEVDATYVNTMKDALKAGRLQVDTDTLAQALMDFYRS